MNNIKREQKPNKWFQDFHEKYIKRKVQDRVNTWICSRHVKHAGKTLNHQVEPKEREKKNAQITFIVCLMQFPVVLLKP